MFGAWHPSHQHRSGGRGRWDCSLSVSRFLVLISFGSLSVGGGSLRGKPLVLFLDFREFAHVFEEVWASLESNEQLRLLAAFGPRSGALTLAGDWDCHGADGLEHGVVVPYEVLGGDDASGDGIAKSVKLDGLMDLEVALSEEYVEVGVFLDRDVDLTRVFRTGIGRLVRGILLQG